MNPVRDALIGHLTQTAAVTDLLADGADGVYHRVAEINQASPYVIVTKMAGTPTYTMGGLALQSDVWLVKAVHRARTSRHAEDIAAAIDAALTDAQISIDGSDLLDLRRLSDVDYGEPDGDHLFHHCGATWRVTLAPT
jgi:hypothetical protein